MVFFVDLLCFCSVLCLLCLCARLFICALWSPVGKRLPSWLLFVVSNCEFVTFPLVSWVRYGTWLYRFLIFAPLLTLIMYTCKKLIYGNYFFYVPRQKFFCGSFMFFCLMFVLPLWASVVWCLVVTCLERVDLLALVCGVYCEFATFPLISWVRCGTRLYGFLIFAPLLSSINCVLWTV